MEYDFILAQKAKSKNGSDKYINTLRPSFNLYIPQDISRINNKVHQSFIVIFKPKKADKMGYDFILAQKAKSKNGSDKYINTLRPSFNLYIPQDISRVNNQVHESFSVFFEPKEDKEEDKEDKEEDIIDEKTE